MSNDDLHPDVVDAKRLDAIISDLEADRQIAWDHTIRFTPVILKASPEVFMARFGRGDWNLEQIPSVHGDAFEVKLRRLYPEGEDYVFELRFFRLLENIWIISALQPQVVFSEFVKSISKTGAAAAAVFLSTKDFRSVLDGSSSDGGEINVLHYSAFDSKESSIRYMRARKSVGAVFSEIASNSTVIRKMTVAILDRSGARRVQFKLSNSGSCALAKGSIGFVLRSVLFRVAQVAVERNRLFSNRARQQGAIQTTHH